MNKKIFTSILSLTVLVLPMVVYGESLIPCGNPEYVVEGVTIPAQPPCDFNYLIKLVNNIIYFLIYYITVPLAALGFMWAGANLVLNQDKESAWSDAKERFWDIGKGFAIILGAYVLIKIVLGAFLGCDQIEFMRFIVDLGSCTP